MDWSAELVGVAAMFAAVLGFLWSLHGDMRELSDRVTEDIAGVRRDVGQLSERVARVEGLLEGMRGSMLVAAEPPRARVGAEQA